MIRRLQSEAGTHTIYGSGSFVSCNGKFYLLTCCHNFLNKKDWDFLNRKDWDRMSILCDNDVDVEWEMKSDIGNIKYDSVLFCIPHHVLRSSQMHGTDSFGTGSFVSSDGKFYLLTCCHNFLSKEDGDKLIEPGKEDADVVSTLKVNYMKEEMKNRCKRTKYHCFNKDFNGTVPLPANVVLANPDDPVLIFNMVSDIWLSQLCKPKLMWQSRTEMQTFWLSWGKRDFCDS